MKGTAGKIISQKGGLLNFIAQLMKVGLPLMKNVLMLLVKSVLIPLGLMETASVTDAAIQKTIYGSGMTTIIIISNEEMKDIMKIAKSLEESGLLIKGVKGTIKNEAKEPKGRFLSMLLGTLVYWEIY